jgi:hypothetical protein
VSLAAGAVAGHADKRRWAKSEKRVMVETYLSYFFLKSLIPFVKISALKGIIQEVISRIPPQLASISHRHHVHSECKGRA